MRAIPCHCCHCQVVNVAAGQLKGAVSLQAKPMSSNSYTVAEARTQLTSDLKRDETMEYVEYATTDTTVILDIFLEV